MVSEAVSKTESPPLIGPRISFSADLSDGGDFICISPAMCKELEKDVVKRSVKVADFEFLSENVSPQRMLTADELFSEGKLLPFWQEKHSEKLQNVNLKTKEEEVEEENRKVEVMMEKNKDEENNNNRVSWFIDEDPSPRPPKCTVLWKELLRLKKQRNSSSVRTMSSLSPSSSTSSSSSLEDAAAKREEKEKEGKRGKKGLERTRSSSMRIRPMIHVPICTPKSSVPLPPLFPLALKKNRVERRT